MSKKCFAVVSVALMLLMGFQVLVAYPVSAEPADVTPDSAVGSPQVPFYGDLPVGSVETLSSSILMETSTPGEVVLSTYLTVDKEEYRYWSPYGTFIINSSHPESVALVSLGGTLLVQSAYFTLFSEKEHMTSNPVVVKADDVVFEVSYDILESDSLIARMNVIYNFADGQTPKITATVTEVDSKLINWNVIWVIVPNQMPPSEDGLRTEGIESVIEKMLLGDLKAELPIGADALKVDWSDAKHGVMEVSAAVNSDGKVASALKISFQKGEKIIDPTLIGSSSDTNPTLGSFQRKTFWYNGYYWLFYNSGSAICYRNSIDGSTWSSAVTLPSGTTPASGSGFDVACRGGDVAVGWINTLGQISFKKGTLLDNKISWSDTVVVQTVSTTYIHPVSVAIDYDGSFWIGYFSTGTILIKRSLTGSANSFTLNTYSADALGSYDQSNRHSCVLLPVSPGVVALLEACAWSNSDDYYARVRYCNIASGWTTAANYNIGMDGYTGPLYKSETFSAVASSDGTIHIAYRDNTANKCIRYTSISSSGTVTTTSEFPEGTGYNGGFYPSICLDAGGILHIFYMVNDGNSKIYHRQKPLTGGAWSGTDLVYTSSQAIKGVTAWANPVDKVSIAWSEANGASIYFASTMLPFGSGGASFRAWERDGLSPYGTYFAQNGDSVSPGSGTMIMAGAGISVPGRGGVDLGVSTIYKQPRYFFKSNGLPYAATSYPFCSIGQYWSLDLPWMDDYYVGLGNGERFVIQWGNGGVAKEFVNHGGTEFTLRDVTKGTTTYYELITSSGVRYEFNHASPYRLEKISSLIGYDPVATTYTAPSNLITLSYDGSNRLTSMTDSCLGRSITFTYDGNGYLTRITGPDGGYVGFTYVTYGSYRYLATITDQAGRVTTFAYNSGASYLLSSATYPSNARVEWTYARDDTPATEEMSWLVTSETTRNATTNALIRQTSFDYKIINGKVLIATLTSYDGKILQGSTRYLFQTVLGYQQQTDMNATGAQMQRSVTWFNWLGQPVRVDTYLGDSTSINYTTYTSFDQWGNVIFTQNPLGYQTYASYVGPGASSFKGGQTLTRISSGLIFFDCFDDLDSSDWIRNMGDGTNSFDVGANPHSPAMKIVRTGTGGEARFDHTFGSRSSDFFTQASLMTNMVGESRMVMLSGTNERIMIRTSGGNIQYYNSASQWITVAPCSANCWYDIALHIHPSSNTYDIYVDGTVVASGISMRSSGNIDRISFQNRPTTNNVLWFTNVRLYSSLTVAVNGLPAGYRLNLVDVNNKTLCSSSNGVLTIIKPLMNVPPASIIIVAPDGSTFNSPVMDVWGGDTYAFNLGITSTGSFYTNTIKSYLHDRVSGVLTIQDYGVIVTEEMYYKYDFEGNPTRIKSVLSPSSVYAQYTYDQYGNVLSSMDNSGVITCYDYSSSNGYTYPIASRSGGKMDMLESDTSWQSSKSSSNGDTSWLTAAYSTARAYDGSKSLQLSFTSGPSGYDSGAATMYKEFYTNSISTVSVQMYCEAYSHNNGWSTEAMDSGVRVRLFDSAGVNYATYTYWLACWYYQQNNRTAPDQYTKVIYGQPTMNTWLNPTLNLNSDFTIDWSNCDKVRIEIYAYGTGANGDSFKIYFDDITYNDSPSAGSVSTTDNFETVGVWQVSSYRSWLTGQYVTDRSFSPDHSLAMNAYGAQANGQDYGLTTAWKEISVNRVSQIVTKMYVSSYAHTGGTWDDMDSGIRMRLYDANGNNYVTYTYWLACWYQSQNTKNVPDAYTKRVYSQPTMNSWLTVTLNPNTDFTIDWSRCSKVKLEIYVNIQGAYGDQFKAYYDDLTVTYTQHAQSIATYAYDLKNGNLLATIDPLGRSTGYQYDVLRRKVRVNNPDGTDSTTQYDDQHNKATSYDELDQKTVSYYDELGRLKRVERYGLAGTPYSSVSYTYTWQDKVMTSVDELGRITRCSYDYLGRNTVTQYFDGTSTSLNVADNFETVGSWTASTYASTSPTWLAAQYSTAQSYSTTHSLETSFTNGAPMSYDTGGAMMYKDYQASQVSTVSVKMKCTLYSHSGGTWDDMDAGVRIRLYDANGVNYVTYTYWLACWYQGTNTKTAPDTNTKVIYGQPTMNTWVSVSRNLATDFSGIDWSRCEKVRFELYTAVTGAYGDQLSLYFDDFAFTGSYNNNARTTTIYDDRNAKVTQIDEIGNKIVYVHDYLGRLNATREYYSATAFYQTLMSYDAVGNLKTVRQANGDVTRMYYDRLNRQTSITYPDSKTESWTYDYAGRVLTSIDRNGAVTTSAYDTAGRAIRTIGTSDKFITKYDAGGQVLKTSNSLGSISYQYNSRGLVSSMTEVIGQTSYSLSYTYDDTGKVTAVTYPDSKIITYIYDDKNRVSQVKSGNTQLLSLTYYLDGSINTKTECNGNSTMSYTYNYRGWVSTIQARDRSNNLFLGLTYTYDGVGNVRSIVSAVGGAGTENYYYDALGRLTQATGVWGTIEYGYDSVGNRLWIEDSQGYHPYSYSTYNKLTNDGAWTYAYDNNGNVIWKNSTSSNTKYNYIYNSFGQMTSVVRWVNGVSSTIALYSYDANGARAKTVEGSATNVFVYNGHDAAYQLDSSGKHNKYVYVGGLELRTISATESYSYISDALGSTRFVLKNGNKDVNNVMFSAVTYKPFGEAVTTTGSDRITFAGEAVDSPTGLVYLYARYMDPSTGRFFALDPELGSLSAPQVLNRYVYCINNPLHYIDPNGRNPAAIGVIIGISIGVSIEVGLLIADYFINGKQFTTEDVLKMTAVGAVEGAGMLFGPFGNFASGYFGELLRQYLYEEEKSLPKAFGNGVMAAIFTSPFERLFERAVGKSAIGFIEGNVVDAGTTILRGMLESKITDNAVSMFASTGDALVSLFSSTGEHLSRGSFNPLPPIVPGFKGPISSPTSAFAYSINAGNWAG